MSMSGDLQQFQNLLQQLLNPANNVRDQAEASFNAAVQQHPDQVALSLVSLLRNSEDKDIKDLSSVLLRKTLTSKSNEDKENTKGPPPPRAQDPKRFWNKLNPSTRQTIKNELLTLLSKDAEISSVRTKIADAVTKLSFFMCSSDVDIQKAWPELLPFLFQLSKSGNPEHRSCALDIFSKLCLYLGEALKSRFDVLKEVLYCGLKDDNLEVRLSALGAVVSFVQLLDSPQEKAQFSDFVPMMFETLSATLNANKEQAGLEALQILVDLADIEPTFLRSHLEMVINAMLTIANTSQLNEAMRQLSLEFLVTLAEQKPGMVRKISTFPANIIPVVLNFMLELDDEWDQEDDEDDSVEVCNCDVGNESIDRLALALGGKTVAPVLFNLIPSLFKSDNWKQRHTALMAISLVGEGCDRYLRPHLQNVIDMILPLFKDPHPRVRWAACNTIGQMSSDFGPTLQVKFHNKVIPALAEVMADQENPRVMSHAASAVINFCEHCTSEILEPYLDGLLVRLVALLQTGKRIVQEQAITAVAAISDVVGDKFTKYYDTFIPFLMNILKNATGKEHRKLRGKAMECISLIGVAVGKDKFSPHAKEVMDVLMRTQQSNLDADDPQLSFMFQAWARICKAIGQDFIPYLDFVMPPLMVSAKLDPDLTITDDEGGQVEKDGWQYIPIGDKRIGINTSVMEEKATACNMLYQYATGLKGGFFPYVEPVAKLLIPLLKFYFHDGVRTAAISTMPSLLECVSEHLAATNQDRAPLFSLLAHILDKYIPAMQQEIDLDILLLMIETVCECLDVCKDNCLSADNLKKLCVTVNNEISERASRMETRAEERQNEDFDEEEAAKLERENEKEDEILSQLAEILFRLVQYHKEAFLGPFSETLLQTMIALLQPNRAANERQIALCVFDDIAEYAGPKALPMFQHFIPLMLDYMGDANPSVRQAAVYGIGVCCQVGQELMSNAINDVVHRLLAVITHSESRSEDNVNATENAISSLGKIIRFHAKSIDETKLLDAWLSFLPVSEDKVESAVIYSLLCWFIENKTQLVFGPNYRNLPKILALFAFVRGTPELLNKELDGKIGTILQQLQSNLPAELLQKAVAALPADQAKLL